jgi:hypothetical protein
VTVNYSYFNYDGSPCRVATGSLGKAETYVAGVGFVDAPKMTILHEGRPISKSEFEAMVIAIARASHADA